jgi:D-alanine-D-alanine ligase
VTNKKRIAVLYGGNSGEHDVSVISASSVMEHLDERYDVTPVFIARDGAWPVPFESLRQFDAVFPVLHGPNGEDGTVQGMLTLLGVPFVGAGVVGSAVGMDKVIFKDVMRAHNLPVTPYKVVRRADWARDKTAIEADVIAEFGFPVFTKPANMGSSVGITRCDSVPALHAGVDEALKWDRKILIEKAVYQPRELEVSVLGNDALRASAVGEIVPHRAFYDYQAKYFAKGDEASELIVPAAIPEPLSVLMREIAVEVATLADVRGMARVDFLMDTRVNEVFVSEINTIPGFTDRSMYPRMWQASGLSYTELLDELIALALA